MWQPEYEITNKILSTIRQIGEVMGAIGASGLSTTTLAGLEKDARELSTFASTSIEGNPLSLTDVKHILKNKPDNLRDTEREIVNYNKALEHVYKKVKNEKFRLNIAELENIQAIITEGLMDNAADIGHLRQRPVIIRDPKDINNIVFIPPDFKDVYKLTEDLCNFTNGNKGKVDPVILAGIFHRQSVIIHPFMDGNGRTTRVVTTALLGMLGLNIFKIFSFENYYNRNITRYFNKVGLTGDYYDHKKIDFTGWLEYFADGILDELKRVQKNIKAKDTIIRIPEHYKIILDYLAEHGSISQMEYGNISKRSLAARKQDFMKMHQMGLIESRGKGKNTYYIMANG